MEMSHRQRLQHVMGVTVLALLFCASAFVTVAYLSGVPTARATTQTSAAASVRTPDPFLSVTLVAKSAYVKDLTTGVVLYALNADAQLPLASITKVATVLAATEVLSPDMAITIPRDTAPQESTERLVAGEKWLLGDVINFTLIESSNTGAEIIAEAADVAMRARYPNAPAAAVLWRMNDLVSHLGLQSMYFLNPSGLDESTTLAGAYGSARDVAGLFAYAASERPAMFEGTARNGALLTSLDGAYTMAYNTDQALGSIPGLVMGKTGYTDLAGGNLAIIFEADLSHPVIAVVLASTYDGRFSDMKQLVKSARAAISQER